MTLAIFSDPIPTDTVPFRFKSEQSHTARAERGLLMARTKTLCHIGCLTAAWSFRPAAAFLFKQATAGQIRSLGALTTKNFMAASDEKDNPNKLLRLDSLRHNYFALRHGQSLANVAKLIQSNPSVACKEYGLSEEGFQQAEEAGNDVASSFQSRSEWKQIVILTSDLKRALETAQTVESTTKQAGLTVEFHVETRLRERWFGQWDGTSDDNYHEVWRDDKVDADHTKGDVESVNAVTKRATEAVTDWDQRLESPSMVICVAHGDVLQILQTAFLKRDGKEHRSIQHLETAQLRALELAELQTIT